jgi:hypothetical protein
MLSRFAATGGGGDPYWANVSYLLVGNGANGTTTNIKDSSSNNIGTTIFGNTVISTSQSKYGGSSVFFDGIEDYLKCATSSGFTFGTGDFTIEFWMRANSIGPNVQILYDMRPSVSGAYPVIYTAIAGNLNFFVDGSNVITGATITTGSWQYVALCRASGQTKLFLDGSQTGSTYADSNNYLGGANRPYIGGEGLGGGYNFNGYLYDLRVTKGVARYTSNFTPPTAPLPTYGP